MRESETRRDDDTSLAGSTRMRMRECRGEARRVGGEDYEGAAGRARKKMMTMAKSDGKESTIHCLSCRRCPRTLLLWIWIGNVWWWWWWQGWSSRWKKRGKGTSRSCNPLTTTIGPRSLRLAREDPFTRSQPRRRIAKPHPIAQNYPHNAQAHSSFARPCVAYAKTHAKLPRRRCYHSGSTFDAAGSTA